MAGDIEKMMYDVRDSVKMQGMGDRLEQIINDTKVSAGLGGMRSLSDDELELVAGGNVKKSYANHEFLDEFTDLSGNIRSGQTPRGGLTC